MKTKLQIIIFFFFLAINSGFSQIRPERDDAPASEDSEEILQDTIPLGAQDSTFVETISLDQIKLSTDTLDAQVDYGAKDSMNYDLANQKVYLYGEAYVKHKTINLKADFIIFDWVNNIVEAETKKDSLGQAVGLPEFEDGDQKFKAKKMRYNFKTKKGIVYDVTTQEGDLFVLGTKTKFYAKGADTTQVDNVVYNENALITTCNHPEPHFGIRASKIKVIPNKVAVVGPSNLEIAGVPTPAWLPFGFFPINKGQTAGFIFPRDYEYSPQWGFGIEEIGYYTPIGEYFDLAITGDIYLKGAWRLKARSNYRKRYKYNGSFNLSYASLTKEENAVVLRDKSFRIAWSHRQDAKAHPTNNFSGSVNIQTNDFQRINENDANSVLQNTLSSNLNFTKRFPGKPYNLAIGLSHSQNTLSREVQISFPTVNFRMNRIFPFKNKQAIGKEKWFEKISLTYNGEAKNRFIATDTTLFTAQTLEDAKFGVQHNLSTDASYRVLKYFNITPSINYKEVWYFDALEKTFSDDLIIKTDSIFDPTDGTLVGITQDTTAFGQVIDRRDNGFTPFREFDVGITIGTQIFGTRLFSNGWLRGLRHVIKPSLRFSYTPDYTDPRFNYFKTVQTDTRAEFNVDQEYSVFEGGIYGQPSTAGEQMALSYSIVNLFEAKYHSKRDSTDKKIKPIENLNINGNYNFAADSLNFSQVSFRALTRVFNGMTNITVGATYDPYVVDEDNRRINEFSWNRDKKILRFVRASANLNTSLSVSKIRDLFVKKKKGEKGKPTTGKPGFERPSLNPEGAGLNNDGLPDPLGNGLRDGLGDDFENDLASRDGKSEKEKKNEDLLDLLGNFRINHTFSLNLNPLDSGDGDTLTVGVHTLDLRGNLQLTENWRISVGRIGYDFKAKSLTYPDFSFYRNLHCWEMGMSWQPQRGTYSFFIRVKPSSLDFIDIPYKKNQADAFNRAF